MIPFLNCFNGKREVTAFEAKAVNFNEKVFTPLALEHIILDVLRMMDELPDIMKSIGSMDTLFKKTGRAVSVNDEDGNGKMSPEEVTVFNLLDGHTSVQDLVDKSLLGRYTSAKTLKTLLDNDYVEMVHYDVQEVLKNKVIQLFTGKASFDHCRLFYSCFSCCRPHDSISPGHDKYIWTL